MAGRVARLGIVPGLVLGIVLAVSPLRPAFAGGGGCHDTKATSARTTTIALAGACFTPTLARVPVGTVVTWVNKDPMVHTVTGANGAWGSYDDLNLDGKVTVRFTRAGVYPYFCFYHPGMTGAVLVGDANGPGAADLDITAASSVVRTDGVSRAFDWSKEAAAQRIRADKAEGRNATQRWFALPIGLVTVALGFGVGRRRRPASA